MKTVKQISECILINAQSLLKNFHEIKELVLESRPVMVGVTETHITSDIFSSEFEISGYKMIRANSHSRHTGGTTVYIEENVNFKLIKITECNPNYWMIQFLMILQLKRFNVNVGYHSPNGDHNAFGDFMDDLMEHTTNAMDTVLVMGDFNCDWNRGDGMVKRLKESSETCNMEQLVKLPTRVTKISNTILDIVLTNDQSNCISTKILDTPCISDHKIVIVELISYGYSNIKSLNSALRSRKFVNWKRYNKIKFQNDLANCSWNWVTSDVNELSSKLLENLTKCKEAALPTMRVSECKANNTPWFNEEIYTAIKVRNESFRRATVVNNDDEWAQYRLDRNKVTNVCRKAERTYYEMKIDSNKGNSKEMWKTLKELVKTEQTNFVIDKVKDGNGELVTDCGKIAKEFNKYFLESINNLIGKIRVVNPEDVGFGEMRDLMCIQKYDSVHKCELNVFKEINIGELNNIVNNLQSKLSSSDGISSVLLKDAYPVIKYQLLDLVNTSIRLGHFPDNLKEAVIVPVPKIANAVDMENFRPINMLSVVDKILELVIHKQLCDYFELHELLMVNQSGFRRDHSCETAVLNVLDRWLSFLDEGKYVLAVFVDLRRAFETVNVNRLIEKLKFMYNIKGRALQWISEYLTHRYQKVKINDITSNTDSVQHGVPQGSILGPLLFIVYMNDVTTAIRDPVDINLYADDMVISTEGKIPQLLVENMNVALRNLDIWLDINKLIINTKKTKGMLIGNKRIEQNFWSLNRVTVKDDVIEIVNNFKYLGVILDSRLDFKEHCDYITKKVNKKVGYLRRIRSKVSTWAAITMYNVMVKPILEYCMATLANAFGNNINKIQVLQNRAMRSILRRPRLTPITDMLKELGWLNVKEGIKLAEMTSIYKIENKLSPSYMCDRVKYVKAVHDVRTRQYVNNHLFIKYCKTKKYSKSLFIAGMKQYNKVPGEIKSSKNVKEFRRLYTKMLKENRTL